MNKKTVSIIGLGWLGWPLALSMAADYTVKGSVSSEEKCQKLQAACDAIDVKRLSITEEEVIGDIAYLCTADYVVITLPARRVPHIESLYTAQLSNILKHIPATSKVVFCSATSVYPSENQEVNEKTPIAGTTFSSKALVKVEAMLREALTDRLTIVRLAGLVGPDRHPGRFFKEQIYPNGDAKVNLVHQTDCVNAIQLIIKNEAFGKVYNLASPDHAIKKDFYPKAAAKLGKNVSFEEGCAPNTYKVVNGNWIVEDLGFQYECVDLMEVFAL